MNGYKYLIKNIGLLTLSNFATKLLSFFLVPLYTNILTTTEYGTYDLFNTTIGVLLPILTLNIQEAVLRFSMDKHHEKAPLVTVAFKYFVFSNICIVIGLIINNIFKMSLLINQYAVYFFLMFFAQSLTGIVTMYTRGIDKISDISISSVIASIVTISTSILFLVFFKFGLQGYFLANIIGALTQCIYLIIKAKIISDIKLSKKFRNEAKYMTEYSKPLIANSIAWWVNNASDRYIVTFFCGLAENGIYSVASKIPSILNIFQSIFNQAWTLSVVKDYDSEDSHGFFTNTYNAYNCMMVILCSLVILSDKFLAKILFAKDFYISWMYVPWLTMAIVFGALSGYLGGFFSAVKDSKIFATSTIIGAITNLVLNFILTPVYGAMGAAVATTICYVIVWIVRLKCSRKYVNMKINIYRDVISYVLLVLQSIFIMFESIKMYLIVIILFIAICLLYIKDIQRIFDKIKRRFY